MDAGEYRERLRLELADLGVATWEDDTLDQALRQALEDYNDVNPDQAIATHTFASASREAALSASTFARLIRVLRVWLPYTASDPEHPPKWRAGFELWPGNILYIADDPEPAASDVARVWFARAQTVEGLDAAASTTLPGEHSQMLVTGSSGYAASARASALRETVSAEDDSYKQTAGFAFRRLNEFRAGLNRIRARAAGGYVALPVQRRGRVPRQ